jgi:hypothetical protein
MVETEIPVSPAVNDRVIERFIDESVAEGGWQISLRGTLKKYPGCVHWHLKRPSATGTLEVTWWPQQHRAWFTIQSGRAAPWIQDDMNRLSERLQSRLRGMR